MTAEVAVLNTHGIALATDSAITVSAGGERKVYNTANKSLFSAKLFYGGRKMTKVSKSANDFLKEYFPKSYLVEKNEEEASLQYYIDTSTELFNQTVKQILMGKYSTPNKNKRVRTSAL